MGSGTDSSLEHHNMGYRIEKSSFNNTATNDDLRIDSPLAPYSDFSLAIDDDNMSRQVDNISLDDDYDNLSLDDNIALDDDNEDISQNTTITLATNPTTPTKPPTKPRIKRTGTKTFIGKNNQWAKMRCEKLKMDLNEVRKRKASSSEEEDEGKKEKKKAKTH
ncbi:hypothetical protein AC579_7385 [Pseudocercospora musae]|uniref:Uncharacterized protein n=1 Tax=Pseudocercospora musae TaxID=113226 RepID=A0A139H8A4_9PEZI|nr:hypothetical protein AC579_7385 [Pseudocercospora musae]